MKNYEDSSSHKYKNTAKESKKRLEQLSKQLKVNFEYFYYYRYSYAPVF